MGIAAVLLPHLAPLHLSQIWLKGARIRIEATTGLERVGCPDCGTRSGRVHSRYVRRLTDAGIGGREVMLALTVQLHLLPCQREDEAPLRLVRLCRRAR